MADVLAAAGHRRVGLLGTRFTMEQAFYRERLQQRGVEVIVPDAADRDLVHTVIYDELCKGRVLVESRNAYSRVIERLHNAGATAVILGCTEICLLIGPEHSVLPVFDTTRIHAERAVERALADDAKLARDRA
jgi:aspartate racemase